MKMESNLQMDLEMVQKECFNNKLTSTPGIWMNGKTYWIQNGYEKLIPEHSISVHIKQVQKHSKIQYNEIFVRNHSLEEKTMKILMLNHYTKPFKEHVSFVSPIENVIFHSIDNQLFLVNGVYNGQSMEQRTVQPIWNVHTERIWSDNERGILKYQPIVKGASVSIFSLTMTLRPQSTNYSRTWSISGREEQELFELNQLLFKTSTSILQ